MVAEEGRGGVDDWLAEVIRVVGRLTSDFGGASRVSHHVRTADHHMCEAYKRWQGSPAKTTDVAAFTGTTGRPTSDSGGSSGQPPFRSRLAKYMQQSKASRSRKPRPRSPTFVFSTDFRLDSRTLEFRSSIDGHPPSPGPSCQDGIITLDSSPLRILEYESCNLQIYIPPQSMAEWSVLSVFTRCRWNHRHPNQEEKPGRLIGAAHFMDVLE
ncbi:hypothetical protein BKA82DRAFT_28068 [Pisolithus tinctorius]|uniref:Uncharacterized protein n=1 Tax=Pisolithus tinctorius Marx 270 TaxID=870435 RepID=A0A0C3P3S0_PISTI|nr:hypothetical protein BKA82DRAFT_28068 [Pisolithus tinctorius]KIO02111.1 hypothetical protein M404DRAFT_28068 [Pisolithus tinctorius Marx 270]